MHPFAMETAAILVHSLNRFSLCTKMAAVAVAQLLLCCDIICKCSIATAESACHENVTPNQITASPQVMTVWVESGNELTAVVSMVTAMFSGFTMDLIRFTNCTSISAGNEEGREKEGEEDR